MNKDVLEKTKKFLQKYLCRMRDEERFDLLMSDLVNACYNKELEKDLTRISLSLKKQLKSRTKDRPFQSFKKRLEKYAYPSENAKEYSLPLFRTEEENDFYIFNVLFIKLICYNTDLHFSKIVSLFINKESKTDYISFPNNCCYYNVLDGTISDDEYGILASSFYGISIPYVSTNLKKKWREKILLNDDIKGVVNKFLSYPLFLKSSKHKKDSLHLYQLIYHLYWLTEILEAKGISNKKFHSNLKELSQCTIWSDYIYIYRTILLETSFKVSNLLESYILLTKDGKREDFKKPIMVIYNCLLQSTGILVISLRESDLDFSKELNYYDSFPKELLQSILSLIKDFKNIYSSFIDEVEQDSKKYLNSLIP